MKKKKMDLNNFKIGYASYSDNFQFCGDRRRFCFFAKETNLIFTKYKSKSNYDIAVLSPISDLSEIKKLKDKGTKVILELVDSYLIKTNLIEDILRSTGRKYMHKKYLNMFYPKRYTSELKRALKKVDAVICTTEDQKRRIQKYNKNVHIILDSFDDDLFIIKPSRYTNNNSLNILWEGLAPNLINFKEIASELNKAGDEININLHILTDLITFKFFSKYYKLHSIDIMKKYKLKINTFLYQWNPIALGSLSAICDLAIIPLLQNNNFVVGKPENKLILLWKLGLPVLTSYSESYASTMKNAGLDMVCKDKEDWSKSLLEFYRFDNDKRIDISKKARAYAIKNYTKKKLIDKWNDVFKSIL